MSQRLAYIAGAVGTLVLVGMMIWQFDDFLALDAASRASWVQAIGTILAIVFSAAVAIWIDQGTANRIAAEREEKLRRLREAVRGVLLDGASAVEVLGGAIGGKVRSGGEINTLTLPTRASLDVIASLLRQELTAELIEPLARAKIILRGYLGAFMDPDSLLQNHNQTWTFDAGLADDARQCAANLRAMAKLFAGVKGQ